MARQIAVHIIESPSSPDRKVRRGEGVALAEALRLHGIGVSLHDVRTHEAFKAAFLDVADWHSKRRRTRVPIIHVSAHGNDSGIRLTSGQRITWNMLAKCLGTVAMKCDEHPAIAMSSCRGFFAFDMEEESGDPLPYRWLVGSSGKPDWSQTLVGFSTLYHQLSRGVRPRRAVESMKRASLHGHFRITVATAN